MEVSVVVVCVSIIAALALAGFIRYRRTARMSEATNLIGSIKVEQEAHKGESGLYMPVSNNISSYYPAANPGKFVTAWGGPCGNCVSPTAWKALNVNPGTAVAYGYATVAGVGEEIQAAAGGSSSGSSGSSGSGGSSFTGGRPTDGADDDDAPPSPGGSSNACTSIAPTAPFYLIKAQGDTDGDGISATVLALSCSNSLIMTNVGE